MADVPPYPALPDEGASLDTLQHNAEWAKTFEPSVSRLPRTTTSLALRRRQHQDVRDYADALEMERAAAQEERLMQDRDAANYALRSRAMDMKDRMDRFKIGTDLRKLENAERNMDSMLRAREAQIAAAEARKIKDANVAEQQARRQAALDNFQAQLATNDALPDTPEYDEAIIAASRAHPLAEHDVATRALVNRAREAASKRATARAAEQKAKELNMLPRGVTATGAVTFGAAENQDTNAELTGLKSELIKAEAKESMATEDEKPTILAGIQSLRQKIANIESPAPPSGVGMGDLKAAERERGSPTIPTLTAKEEFDKLPSGAEYIRDGRRYRKP